MPVYEVNHRPGNPKLGSVASSHRGKRRPIESLVVYSADSAAVGIRISHDGGNPVLNLSQTAALEVAIGILMNLHDTTIACSEELQNVLAQAVKRSDDEAKAVIDCLKRL